MLWEIQVMGIQVNQPRYSRRGHVGSPSPRLVATPHAPRTQWVNYMTIQYMVLQEVRKS